MEWATGQAGSALEYGSTFRTESTTIERSLRDHELWPATSLLVGHSALVVNTRVEVEGQRTASARSDLRKPNVAIAGSVRKPSDEAILLVRTLVSY